MKRKTMALMLALSMCLSLLSACGSGNTATDDKPPESENVVSSTEQPEESEKPEESKEQPEESEEPKEEEPEESEEPKEESNAGTEPAVPAEMTYTFATATGTLTCSGGGEISRADYLDVIKNTLFETDEYKCMQEIKKVVIEDGVTAIGGEGAFAYNEITEIAIPGSVTRIGYAAFYASQIASAAIPDSVTELGDSIFGDCLNLSSVTLPKNVTTIPEDMFSGCTSLTSIQIPESVTTIEHRAFYGCGLTSITIPDGVTSIGRDAFANCPLTQFTIPAGVTQFDSHMLKNCTALTDVTFLGDTDMDHVEGWVSDLLEKPLTIHAPAGSVIEGYVNRQIQSGDNVKCTFEPIN